MSAQSRKPTSRSDPSLRDAVLRPSLHSASPSHSPSGAERIGCGAAGQMDARSLRDAGISPAAAAYESGKPFWQPMGSLR